jgi:hypothetical protein
MRTLLTALSICVCWPAISQNTGIGTVNPQGKLQINNNNGLRPTLLLADSALLSGGSIRWQNIVTDKWMELRGAATTAFSNGNALLIGSDSITIASFNGTGRVGIRNTAPTEALDVNGNINLNGTIKVNGNDGTAGQVLINTGSGGLQWRSPSATGAADENIATFWPASAGAVQTFTVPAGVTKIAVEAWGGGGTGGSTATSPFLGAVGGGGGGGGGYVKAWFTVTPGSTVNIVVGKGGTAATAATASTVTYGAATVSADPGNNAVTTVPALGGLVCAGGRGGGITVSNGFQSFVFVKGADGQAPVYTVSVIGSNQYTDNYQWGRGGDAGNTINTGGTSGQSVGMGFSYHYSSGSIGGSPGGGGGGDRGRITNGWDGLVVVRW